MLGAAAHDAAYRAGRGLTLEAALAGTQACLAAAGDPA
jgi:hypothetical protein